jgi:aminocarboxymuconate-semialdehyde decarboxylase
LAGWDIHSHLAPAGASLPIEDLNRPQALVQRVETLRLDGAIVSIPPPLYDGSGSERRPWATEVNDGLEQVISDEPTLRGFAYLPIDKVEVSLAEISRRERAPWVGFTIAAATASRTLDDPELEPVWQALDDRNAFVFVHPGASPDSRLHRFYLENLLGNPTEIALAAACLIFAGILLRYPGITFCLAHGGGATPGLVGRWEQGWRTARPGIPELAAAPLDAVRFFYADSVVHDPRALELAIQVFGEERILLGTDWPFPMGIAEPTAPSTVLEGLEPELSFAANASQCLQLA